MPVLFPFTAIVGQEKMKRALILNAINPQIGGVLIRGERGTAKSTAARALAALLPEIEVVDGCPFSCDPHQPQSLCDECRSRLERGENLPIAKRKTRFVNLPVSATEDRVVGTLDIERAIKKGEKRFEPGVLAAANRGLLYVDEVNLLDDHVVDLLLDSAAMGVNVVEREGISFSHPARFILVGTMNPEEGEIRPQLLDRFALCVDVKGITDPKERVEILERCVRFEKSPEIFWEEWRPYEEKLSKEIAYARELLPKVTYDQDALYIIAELTSSLSVDGHRADIVILKTAIAQAAFSGRTKVSEADILVAAELALPHRLRKQPFQEAQLKLQEISERLERLKARVKLPDKGVGKSRKEALRASPSQGEKEVLRTEEEAIGVRAGATLCPYNSPQSSSPRSINSTEMPVEIGETFKPKLLETPLDRITRRIAGKRSFTKTSRKRGRYIKSMPANGDYNDIALDATLRQAALQLAEKPIKAPGEMALAITQEDLQRKVRVRRAANTILFVVDASWSMAASERMEAAKGAVLSLLRDAYKRRDRVGLVVFQREEAHLLLPPTSSVELAEKALHKVPVGGKTPLSSGLLLAYRVLKREMQRSPDVMPLMILLTDGAANVSMTELPPQEEALKIADLIRREGIQSVVINMEYPSFDRGLASDLAEALDAKCYNLDELNAEGICRMVKAELGYYYGEEL